MPAVTIRRERLVSHSATVLSLLVLVMGVVNILSALTWIDPLRLHWLRENLPLELHAGSRSLTAVAGLLLIVLSWSLYRRKRQGWLAAVILLAASVALHLVKGLDYEEAGAAALMLGLLVIYRSRFSIRSDRWAAMVALRGVFVLSAATLAYAMLGFSVLRRHFAPEFSPGIAWQSALALFSQMADPALQPLHGHRDAFWLSDSVVASACFTAMYAAFMLIQPVSGRLFGGVRERAEVKALLERLGGPPLGYWALAPGFTYLFSADHHAALAYKVSSGVALALTDPLGDLTGAPELLENFKSLCHTNDWSPAFCQVEPGLLPAYRALGWQALKSGEEAMLRLLGLEFTGKAWQDVRTALNRLGREGYSHMWYDLTVDPLGWRDALATVSSEWLKWHGGRELGFTVGSWRSFESREEEQRLLVLVSSEKQPVAFLSFVPLYAPGGGMALDMLRRGPGSPAGTMEYLLATAIRQFQQEGLQHLSIGTAPLSSEAESGPETANALDRVRELIFEHFNRAYNFKGLKAFKDKFQPQWEPRYLVYPSLAALPRVLLAMLALHNEAHPSMLDKREPRG